MSSRRPRKYLMRRPATASQNDGSTSSSSSSSSSQQGAMVSQNDTTSSSSSSSSKRSRTDDSASASVEKKRKVCQEPILAGSGLPPCCICKEDTMINPIRVCGEAHYVCSECYSEFIKSVTLVWKEDRRDLPYCSKESWVKCPQCRSTSLLSELADNVDHSIDKMLYQCLLKKHFTSKCIHSSCNFETEDVYLMPSHIVKCSASKHAQCQYCDQQVAYTDVSILADVMNIHIKNNCRGLKCIIRQCRSSNTLYTYGELERHLAIHEERRNMRDHLLRAVRDVSNWAEDHRNINMSTSLGTVNDIPYLVTALRSFWRNTRAGHDSSPPLPSVFLQNIIDANQLVDVRRPLSPHSRGLSYANAMDRIIYGNPSFRLDPESEPEQEEADPDSPIILDD